MRAFIPIPRDLYFTLPENCFFLNNYLPPHFHKIIDY